MLKYKIPQIVTLTQEVFLNVQKHFLFYRTVQFEINPTNLLRVIHSFLT